MRSFKGYFSRPFQFGSLVHCLSPDRCSHLQLHTFFCFQLLRFVDWKTQKRSRTEKEMETRNIFSISRGQVTCNSFRAPTVLTWLGCRWLVQCLLLPQTCIFEAEGHLGARVMSAFVFPLATIARALTSTFIGSSYKKLCCFHFSNITTSRFRGTSNALVLLTQLWSAGLEKAAAKPVCCIAHDSNHNCLVRLCVGHC